MLRHDNVTVRLGSVVRGTDSESRPEEDAERGNRRGCLVGVRDAPHDTDRVNKRGQCRDDDKRHALENIVGLVVHQFFLQYGWAS